MAVFVLPDHPGGDWLPSLRMGSSKEATRVTEAVKLAASKLDAWILIEDTLGKERPGVASRVGSLVAPETALQPAGGPVGTVLRWALWFLTVLGFTQGMLAAYWSLETRSLLSVGWLGIVATALVTLAIMRSQPIYSALFASWVGVGMVNYPYRWLDLGPVEITWLLGINATVGIWILLALALVVEWRAELGRFRSLIYRANLIAACFLLPPF